MVKARKRLKSNMVSGRLCYNTFLEEERYMGKYDYPEYSGHKRQHLEFMENF